MKLKSRWPIIVALILIVQLVLEVYAGIRIAAMHMLPFRYLIIIILMMALCFIFTGLFLLLGMENIKSKCRTIVRFESVVLSIMAILGSLLVGTIVSGLDRTMNSVTTQGTAIQTVACVYVKADDPALKIEETKNYVFGIMDSIDGEITGYAVEELQKQLDQKLTIVARPSIVENAAALYNGQIQAIIVNKAYVALLEDTDEYSDFSRQTRVVGEIRVPVFARAEAVQAEENGETLQGIEKESIRKAVDDVTQKPFVVYISGSDTRSTTLDVSRSDVNILAVVNPKTRQILLINTPRDYYIENPISGIKDKLTHCGIYGIDCSIEALANLYETDINYYGQVNFTGFELLIDALGGIDVYVPQGFKSFWGPTFRTGNNHMDGETALAFARSRYELEGGDNDRGKNQMRVIEAVLKKLTTGSTTLLTNYSQILGSMQGMFATDMSQDEIAALVRMQLEDMSTPWNIKTFSVRGTDASETTYSMPDSKAYVMEPDMETVRTARNMIDDVKQGRILTGKSYE